jgi:hypothetical protein
MTKHKRELIARAAMNGPLIACQCSGCNWHASVQYFTNETAGEAAQKAFDAHRCEDYPKGDQQK